MRRSFSELVIGLLLLTAANAAMDKDILIEAFEGDSYGQWKIEGDAFGDKPIRKEPGIGTHLGMQLADSGHHAKSATGKLISPEFIVERRYIKFLVQGGNPRVNLIHDSNVVRETAPGHSWTGMYTEIFDVAELMGKTVHLEVIDYRDSGPLAFVRVDHIMQSDTSMPINLVVFDSRDDVLWLKDFTGQAENGWTIQPKQLYATDQVATITSPEFEITHDFINFRFELKKLDRLDQLAPMSANLITQDGTIIAVGSVGNDWRCWDVSNIKGEKVRVQIVDVVGENITFGFVLSGRIAQSRTFEKGTGVTLLEPFDDIRDVADYYQEQYDPGSDANYPPKFTSQRDEEYRPQFHYSPDHGYCGDPNGLLFYNDTYHLYHQHDEYVWAHAVSTDLMHWTQLDHAMQPDNLGMAWSGSAVVDHHNTAGLQTGDEPALIAFYSSARRVKWNKNSVPQVLEVQSMAYSNDGGNHFDKYPLNPVLPIHNRDPKVFWYEPHDEWIMLLYKYSPPNKCVFFKSKNLKDWEVIPGSEWEGVYECPDMFELPVQGEQGLTKWIVVGANGRYWIGDFNGRKFKPDTKAPIALELGNMYTTQSFSNSEDGRRIQIIGMRTPSPDFAKLPYFGVFAIPRVLTIRPTPEGLRMFSTPVGEVESLYTNTHTFNNLEIGEAQNPLEGLKGKLFDIQAEIIPGDAKRIVFDIRGEKVVCDFENTTMRGDGVNRHVPIYVIEGKIKIRVLVDTSTLEVFTNEGRYALSYQFYPPKENQRINVSSEGGTAKIETMTVHELRSALKTVLPLPTR